MSRSRTADTATSAPRLRLGKTMDERKAERRTQLLDSALDIIGEEGAAGVTVRALCRRTGLTARYFYESFEGRDELIVALFHQVAEEMQTALSNALATTPPGDDSAAPMVEAFVDTMLGDPRKARLMLVETLSDSALSGVTVTEVPTFTRLIRDQLPKDASHTERTLTALGVAGAMAAIFSSWTAGSLRVSRQEIVAHCVQLLNRARIG